MGRGQLEMKVGPLALSPTGVEVVCGAGCWGAAGGGWLLRGSSCASAAGRVEPPLPSSAGELGRLRSASVRSSSVGGPAGPGGEEARARLETRAVELDEDPDGEHPVHEEDLEVTCATSHASEEGAHGCVTSVGPGAGPSHLPASAKGRPTLSMRSLHPGV